MEHGLFEKDGRIYQPQRGGLEPIEVHQREGKYYLQFFDGELEYTAEQMQQQYEASKWANVYFAEFLDKYQHNKWKVADVPADADFYIILDIRFAQLKKFIKKTYIKTKNNIFIRVFSEAIARKKSELERSLINPYTNKIKYNYELSHLNDTDSFIQSLRNEEENDNQNSKKRGKEIAKLEFMSIEQIKRIFKEIGLGINYTKKGEFSAAFRALFVKGILIGNSAQVHAWAKKNFTIIPSESTIKESWNGNGYFEYTDFKSTGEQQVFRGVQEEIARFLKANKPQQ